MESIEESADRLVSDRLGPREEPELVRAILERACRRVRLLRGYDAAAVSSETGLDTGGDTIVQQQFRDECDVNTIVRRFGYGQAPAETRRPAVYGDFTGITDYESAVSAIERARGSFMELPPEVRERFANDPGAFLEFAEGVPEGELMGELGLVAPVEPVAPVAPPVAPVAPGPAAPPLVPPPAVVG